MEFDLLRLLLGVIGIFVVFVLEQTVVSKMFSWIQVQTNETDYATSERMTMTSFIGYIGGYILFAASIILSIIEKDHDEVNVTFMYLLMAMAIITIASQSVILFANSDNSFTTSALLLMFIQYVFAWEVIGELAVIHASYTYKVLARIGAPVASIAACFQAFVYARNFDGMFHFMASIARFGGCVMLVLAAAHDKN
jgi:hypothetical protein